MNTLSGTIASHASFQTFLNCYLREVDPGVWHTIAEWRKKTGVGFADKETHVLELQLEKINITLAVGVCF